MPERRDLTGRKAPTPGDRRGRLRLPGLSGTEQAQRSWARSIRSYAEVPPGYSRFFDSLQAAGQPFPLVVLTPSYEGFLHRELERLLCALPDELVILTERGGELDTVRYPYPGVDFVELSVVLLDARLKIAGGEDRGARSSTVVRFNAVTDYLFKPIVDRIRDASPPSLSEPDHQAADPFREWGRLNYKFMNFSRRSVPEGIPVEFAFLQPEIRVRVLSALGRIYTRSIAPTLATILTRRELILIREVLVRRKQDRYGGIWDFIRLEALEDVEVFADSRGLLGLRVRFPAGEPLQFYYEPTAQKHLESLVEKVDQLRRLQSVAPLPAPPS